ncbi:prohibitin family protein [Gemmatimonas groenlandica]|uniref:Prohibitin family protein n=1 Tax=Gemmatimonas groenlandica TaxID=2732249 RepID=A0A6M4ISI3_9BACT|nr:prohibitin family protein [Gemmatimonas groenlandica]QJR36416.1 prohibitin family protein [Gemmatimonas groenlandica]
MATSIDSTLDELRSSMRNPLTGMPGGGGGRGAGIFIKLAGAFVALLVLLFLVRPSVTYIEPGHVGIVIHRGGGGVDPTPLGPGFHMRNPLMTQIQEYPTYMQTLVLTKASTEGSEQNDEINVNSVEGQPLSLDVSMSFELRADKVPALYQTFRTDVETISHGYIRQAIRQALQEVVGNEEIAAILGPKKAEVVTRSQANLQKRLDPYGIDVRQFTLNEFRAPKAVMDAISLKNVMQQQALTAQNELQKNTFQAQGDSIKAVGRAKAIMAEAEAQSRANDLLSKSITSTLVQYEMAKRWNGQMPQVTGGAMPMLQLPGAKSPE